MGKSQQEVGDLSLVRTVHGGSGRRAGSIGKLTLSMTIMTANFKSKVIFNFSLTNGSREYFTRHIKGKVFTALIAMQTLVVDQAYMPHMKAMYVPFHMAIVD